MFVRRLLIALAFLTVTLPAGLCRAADPAPVYTGMARIDAIAQTPGLFLTPGKATEGAAYGNAEWLKDDAAKAYVSFNAAVPSDAWKKLELTFTPSADGKVRLQLMGEYHKIADAWVLFDSVTVKGAKLDNGDFEQGDKDAYTGWEYTSGYAPAAAGKGVSPHTGTRFIAVCHDNHAAQILAVTKDQPVTVTAWARSIAGAKPLTQAKAAPGQRWERDIHRFELADQRKPVEPGTIVFVGSSSMRMWRTLQKDMAPLTVINRGFGGSTMADALQYVDRIVIPYKPRAVVVYEGDNDAAGKVPVTDFMARAKEFVKKVRDAQPGTPVYFLAVKPSISRWKIWPLMNQYNAALKAWCDATDGLTYIDIATPMLGADGKPLPDIFLGDKLHMNPKGYVIWTDTVRPVMIKAFGEK